MEFSAAFTDIYIYICVCVCVCARARLCACVRVLWRTYLYKRGLSVAFVHSFERRNLIDSASIFSCYEFIVRTDRLWT
jgi:hypothetical protein